MRDFWDNFIYSLLSTWICTWTEPETDFGSFTCAFERFLLAFESHDLSQAEKRITRVPSFPSFNFWMINYSYIYPNKLFGNLAKLFWSFWKVTSFLSLWEVNLRGLTILFCRKFRPPAWDTEKEVPLLITQFFTQTKLNRNSIKM